MFGPFFRNLIFTFSFPNSVYEWYQILEKDINLVWRPDVSFVNVIDTKILPIYGNEESFQLWFSASDNHMEHYQAIKEVNDWTLSYFCLQSNV